MDEDKLNPELAQALLADMSEVKTRMGPIEGALGQIAEALTRLAVLEERHSAVVTVVDKATKIQEKIDGRVSSIEHDVIQIKTTASVMKSTVIALWAVLGTFFASAVIIGLPRVLHMFFS